MDDAKLRGLLRSIIVVAAAAPAGVVAACGNVAPTSETAADAAIGDGNGVDGSDSAVVNATDGSIADGPFADVLRVPPADRCMTYASLPDGGISGYGADTIYEAGICNTACQPPAGADAATPPTACWALRDPTFGEILGCAYPNGDPSQCGCAPRSAEQVAPFDRVSLPLPCRDAPSSPSGTAVPIEQCTHFCPPTAPFPDNCSLSSCTTDVTGATTSLRCIYCSVIIGRRAAGVVAVPPARGTPVGMFLADACHREAASVIAFARMREELMAHGAPRDLVDRTERAGEDERRHASIMGSLAQRFGAEDGPWAIAPSFEHVPERSLEEIAVENAVEGCVFETWSALTTFWQAEYATDRVLRRALAAIAEDELRHASLAWSVLEWTLEQLDVAARARLFAAMRGAVASFGIPPSDPEPELTRDAGVPDCAASRRLIAALDAELWAAAA